MNGNNDGWKYELHIDLAVARDEAGLPYEDLVWSRMHTNTVADPSLAALSFEQKLSLDGPAKYLAIPDLKSVQPPLVGPITDMLTFYSDVFLAHQLMRHSQGHAFFAYGKPKSWADGHRVLLGQDSLDYDVTLKDEQEDTHSAVLVVRHVPPRVPQIALPAPWMQAIAGSPANNWVQVTHTDEGYLAQVGRETFEVHLTLDTEDGKILSSTLENPLEASQRLCQDASLSICGPETPFYTKREVSLRLLP